MSRSGICALILFFSLAGYGQRITFSIEFESIPLDSVLKLVTAKTGYYFSYNTEILPVGSKFSMKVSEISIDDFLNKLLVGTGLMHQIMGDQIILRQKVIQPVVSPLPKPTFSINGQVKDSLSNEPVPGVNVFLSGTNLGGVTDLDGFYSIDKIPLGSFEVIFSHVTYGMKFYDVELLKEGVLTVDALMNQESRLLDTVEVLSRRLIGPEERGRYLRIFENEFLGRSLTASQCKLLNPDVLDFIYDPKEDKLEVFALEPVMISNEYLGYQITYYFEVFQKMGGVVNFFGKARFKEMNPLNGKEERRWLKNRLKVYDGSFLHFRRALVNDRLKQEQFRISLIKSGSLEQVKITDAVEVEREDVLKQTNESEFELDFDGFLMVIYRRKPDESYKDQFFESNEAVARQRSLLMLKDGPILIKSNGRMEYPGVASFGYWYWERIADMLPENFDPDNNIL